MTTMQRKTIGPRTIVERYPISERCGLDDASSVEGHSDVRGAAGGRAGILAAGGVAAIESGAEPEQYREFEQPAGCYATFIRR